MPDYRARRQADLDARRAREQQAEQFRILEQELGYPGAADWFARQGGISPERPMPAASPELEPGGGGFELPGISMGGYGTMPDDVLGRLDRLQENVGGAVVRGAEAVAAPVIEGANVLTSPAQDFAAVGPPMDMTPVPPIETTTVASDTPMLPNEIEMKLRSQNIPQSIINRYLHATGVKPYSGRKKLTDSAEAKGTTNVKENIKNVAAGKIAEQAGVPPTKPSTPEEIERQRKEREKRRKELAAKKATAAHAKKLHRVKTLAELAEGMKKVGRNLTRYSSNLDPGLSQDYEATSLRREQAELEDIMPEEERQYLQQVLGENVVLPAGMKRSSMAMLPKMAGAMGTLRGVEAKERGLDLQEQRMAAMNTFRDAKFKLIPNAVAKDITNANITLVKLDQIQDRYADLASEFGPVWGRLNKLLRTVGWDHPDATALRGNMKETFLRFMYGVGGKQLSDKEIKHWDETIMQATDSGHTFIQMVEAFRENLQVGHLETLKTQMDMGRDVEKHLRRGEFIDFDEYGKLTISQGAYDRNRAKEDKDNAMYDAAEAEAAAAEAAGMAAEQPPEGYVQMRGPEGVEWVHPEDVEKAREQGYKDA